MKVFIIDRNARDWTAAVSAFDAEPQHHSTFEMNGITGPYRASSWSVPDHTPFATWIALTHPEWIDHGST